MEAFSVSSLSRPLSNSRKSAGRPSLFTRKAVVPRFSEASLSSTDVADNVSPIPNTDSVDLRDLPLIAREQVQTKAFELSKQHSFWLLNLVAFLYGSNTTGVKTLLEQSHLAPSIISALRFDIASLALLPLLLLPGIKKCNWPLTFELGVWLALGYGLQSQELLTASASEGSALLALFLVLVPVIELFHGRSLSIKKAAALAVAVIGVGFLSLGGSGDTAAVVEHGQVLGLPEGAFWGLLSSTAFAIHLVRSEVRQHEAQDVGQLAAGQLLVCTLLLNIWAAANIALDPSLASQADPTAILESVPWRGMLFTALFCTAGCQTGELVAVAKIPSSTASLTLSMLVVWGLFAGVVVNHDSLGPLSWFGASLIVAAGIVPKLLDVLADRSAASNAEQAAPVSEKPPVDLSSDDVVRSVAATGMLLEAGNMMLLPSARTATSVAVKALSGGAAGAMAGAAASGGSTVAAGAGAVGAAAASAASAAAASAGSAAASSAVSTAVGGVVTGAVAGAAAGAAIGAGVSPEVVGAALSAVPGLSEAASAVGSAALKVAGAAGGALEVAGSTIAEAAAAGSVALEASAGGPVAAAGNALEAMGAAVAPSVEAAAQAAAPVASAAAETASSSISTLL